MNDRYLFKALRVGWKNLPKEEQWAQGYFIKKHGIPFIYGTSECPLNSFEIYESTICQCTGLKDKAGNLIWENDILMCHNNPKDLVKAVFGEFSVIDADSLSVIDRVIGWHYEVISTDGISKCVPFCLSMPLTDFYIDRCDMKVCGSIFDNPELLEVE